MHCNSVFSDSCWANTPSRHVAKVSKMRCTCRWISTTAVLLIVLFSIDAVHSALPYKNSVSEVETQEKPSQVQASPAVRAPVGRRKHSWLPRPVVVVAVVLAVSSTIFLSARCYRELLGSRPGPRQTRFLVGASSVIPPEGSILCKVNGSSPGESEASGDETPQAQTVGALGGGDRVGSLGAQGAEGGTPHTQTHKKGAFQGLNNNDDSDSSDKSEEGTPNGQTRPTDRGVDSGEGEVSGAHAQPTCTRESFSDNASAGGLKDRQADEETANAPSSGREGGGEDAPQTCASGYLQGRDFEEGSSEEARGGESPNSHSGGGFMGSASVDLGRRAGFGGSIPRSCTKTLLVGRGSGGDSEDGRSGGESLHSETSVAVMGCASSGDSADSPEFSEEEIPQSCASGVYLDRSQAGSQDLGSEGRASDTPNDTFLVSEYSAGSDEEAPLTQTNKPTHVSDYEGDSEDESDEETGNTNGGGVPPNSEDSGDSDGEPSGGGRPPAIEKVLQHSPDLLAFLDNSKHPKGETGEETEQNPPEGFLRRSSGGDSEDEESEEDAAQRQTSRSGAGGESGGDSGDSGDGQENSPATTQKVPLLAKEDQEGNDEADSEQQTRGGLMQRMERFGDRLSDWFQTLLCRVLPGRAFHRFSTE